MIKTFDSKNYKRIGSAQGDRAPLVGVNRQRALYTATGGETSINLQSLTPQITYFPGNAQISIKRSSGGSAISGVDFFETSATTIGFPSSDPLIQGELVEITLEVGISGVMAAQPRPDVYTAVGVAGQTLVSCPFSWTYNMNQAYGIGAVRVYLHGVLQTRGTDYAEVSLGTANTNQIQFVDALVGGENIVVLPSYQVLDQSAAASTFVGQQMSSVQSAMNAGLQAFVDTTSTISVPATSIVGRAKIPDITQDLRASLGIERIMTQQIVQLQNEFGPNGEPVWGAVNDDRGLIRFIGGWSPQVVNSGQYVLSSVSGDSVEITFYGTGLNLLDTTSSSAASADINIKVDGLAAGSLTNPSTNSIALNGRNYSPNRVRNVASGLSLGIHTVSLTVGSNTSIFSLAFMGFEILNSNATGTVNVNPGSAYISGQKYTALTSQSFLYNAPVTGTRGGRVVTYLKADGTIGQAWQAVNSASATLASSDHTNEEVVRTYDVREFGAGRTDDFSLSTNATATNLAFTLDDGTTTLVGSNVSINNNGSNGEYLSMGAVNGFFTLTFVGTGLDIGLIGGGSATSDPVTVQIDGGTSVGTIAVIQNKNFVQKIVSGLPYGTHTVKFTRTATNGWFSCRRFIVYQPKKPSIPAGAIELADYNVMANFVANTAGNIAPSSGVLRKLASREISYSGANWGVGSLDPGFSCGFNIWTTGTGQYAEYTFFGTGIELKHWIGAGAQNYVYTIDGSSNLSSFTTALYNSSTGLSFNPSTGTLSGTQAASAYGVTVSITGLLLGLHKVRVVANSLTNGLYSDSYDIITPIHSPKPNSPADLQNTLPVGSCAMTDSRKSSAIKEALPGTKAWAQAFPVTSNPSTTSTTFVPCPDMSCTVKVSGGRLRISYSLVAYASSGSGFTGYCQLYLNGAPVGVSKATAFTTQGYDGTISDTISIPVAAGVHKVDLYWKINNGATAMANDSGQRSLLVEEA